MKLMTYNILDGGNERLPVIWKVIKEENPDYLTLNEANTFADKSNKILKQTAKNLDFPFFDIALSGEYDYHVAVLSKYRLRQVKKIQPLMRACLVAQVDTTLGEISIASLHLNPYIENLRLPEIDFILGYQEKFKHRILMGDMNSLSQSDNYDLKIIKRFSEKQVKRFTKNGKFSFDAIRKIVSKGYLDAAMLLGKSKIPTASTSIGEDATHPNVRIDYVFISKSLKPYLSNYQVVKNATTDIASDHYPVIAEFIK